MESRTTRKRYNAVKEKKKKKRKYKIFTILIFMILIFFALRFVSNQIVKPVMKGSNPLAILLIGSDIDAYREEHMAGTKPEKTDSLMVVTFNPSTFKFVMTSIPRDTAIDYACKDMRGKVNEIYASSGQDIDCLVESIEYYLNIPIDYYVKVNMDQITEILNNVGEIEIVAHAVDGYLYQENVDNTMFYEWYDGLSYKMDADEALTYARARHDSEKDYGRGIRQQQVVLAIVKEVLSGDLSIDTIQALFAMVDTNMPPLLIKKYYDYVKELQYFYDSIQSGGIDFSTIGSSVADSMMEYFNYKGSIDSFSDYLFKNYSKTEIKEYFIDSNQFYNESYNGYYITPYDQLDEISNKLRDNLNLKDENPNEMVKPFGVNTFEKEISVGEESETTYTDTYTPNEGQEVVEGDTVDEDVSLSTNEDDTTETDNTNGEDPIDSETDNIDGKDPIDSNDNIDGDIDTDGDGLLDIEEIELGTDPQLSDTDGDGLLDSEDDNPLVAGSVDVVDPWTGDGDPTDSTGGNGATEW